ncbi:RloB family protein [Sphingomonas sp. BK069]|uniref:RloB family protein n=1 Tax=Sphingomonas sp. BK069 TaxID=2586979 RepID=UPI001617DAF7|nr:RloB family protein [Sphingomonas sp. BK069]MBB3345957.1 hypothetical protein [Sphingomonas sp. BK069]
MALTSRKKRPLDRVVAVRDARLIIIATEGERSEPIYFDIFHSTRVRLHVVPCVDGKSSPEATLERLNQFKQEYELDASDELWLVIDRDRWTPKMISDIARKCVSQRVNLAVSNPCFEVWLSFHYTSSIPAKLQSTTADGFFRSLHGSYKKGNYDPKPLLTRVRAAINHAEALDNPKGRRWPVSVGSHVYILMKSIIAAGVQIP